MSAYLLVNVDIKDNEKYKEYLKATPSIIKKFGGKFLVRGGDFEVYEGNWNPKRLVVVKFESMQKAKQFYDSPEYNAVKELRQSSAYTEWVFVEGLSTKIFNDLNS